MLRINRIRSLMSSFRSLGESGKRGAVLTFPLQRSEKAHRLPMALLFLHHRSIAKFLPNSSPPSLGTRSARKEESRTQFRRFRVLPRIFRGSSCKARRRKFPRPGAMAMANLEELLLLNDRLRYSRLWRSRQKSERVNPKARAYCAPIRYLRKEILPFPASQIFLLHLQVSEEARRAQRPPLPGKQKGTTSPPPRQKLRKQRTREEGIRTI